MLMLSMSVQYDAQFYIATMLRPWYSCAATPISQSDVSESYCNVQVAGRQQCSKKCFIIKNSINIITLEQCIR